MTTSIEEIEARAAAATPGPWFWGGYRKQEIYLATTRWGRVFVMRFRRMGMHGAQPMFQVYEDREPADDPFYWHGSMVDGNDLAVQGVPYRGDIVRIANPDAEFIAHAREDVDFLLAEVKRLREGVPVGS